MKPNFKVEAEVFNIQSDTPKADDIFLVDSNVWYWYSYTNASKSALPYQISHYPTYVNQANIAGSLLLYSGLSLAELAHQIEENERKVFNPILRAKIYRHNYPEQRNKVVYEVQTAWSTVTSIADCAEILVDENTTNKSLIRFQTQLLDGYDLLMLEAMNKVGVKKIITDDGDYLTVPGIQVFTANNNFINTAKNQGKLVVR
ncbi:MAG: hypothetical protein EA343_21835 [Nodularia sp. (in: Bacteria)]|nr:MAG: hypothetical protein EA343_21835 [Nodularia sp. (in: cyanobacteria)]